jgi:ATP-dependent DNA helicase RecQ
MHQIESIHKVLEKYWGHQHFRPLQLEIIQSILSGTETIGLLPTGGGKSVCFQIPALLMNGYSLIVSPLVALIKDQVITLEKSGIPAAGINYQMSREEISEVYKKCRLGKIKLLYVSPERLQNQDLLKLIALAPPSMIVVDEAHCISQWGQDFRPSYLEIAALKQLVPGIKIHAFTATAGKKVLLDIRKYLDMEKVRLFRKSYRRDNLAFYNIYTEAKMHSLYHFIRQQKNATGIVYVRSRIRTVNIATYLNNQGIISNYYHAGLSMELRDEHQLKWMEGKTRVIVCTNAFGMGVDKADVRFVVHMDLPEDIESYYQEAGRAGRDGEMSLALVLYNRKDIKELRDKSAKALPSGKILKSLLKLLVGLVVNDDEIQSANLKEIIKQSGNSADKLSKQITVLDRLQLIELHRDQTVQTKSKIMISDKDSAERNAAEQGKLILQTIFRLYESNAGGVFMIQESMISEYLSIEQNVLKLTLNQLHHSGLIEYQSADEVIIFRLGKGPVRPVISLYNRWRKAKLRKMQSMIDHLELPMCRQLHILRYFGENVSKACKKCDICRRSEHLKYKKVLLLEFMKILENTIEPGGIDLDELVLDFPFFDQQKYALMMHELYCKERIQVFGKRIALIKR